MLTEGTPFGFGKRLRLPEDMREELRKPMGRLLTKDEFRVEATEVADLVTVGDYCTLEVLRASHQPRIAIVDLKVERGDLPDVAEQSFFREATVSEVDNPAGEISKESWGAIQSAFERDERSIILVRGEEDLLALPAIALAPLGATVAYGMPGEGAVLVESSKDSKSRVHDVLMRMEELDGR